MALGPYHRVLEAGQEFGCVGRNWCSRTGIEFAPQIRRGFMLVPAAMFPELAEEFDQ